MAVPTYPAGGTERTAPMQPSRPTAAAFGGASAAAIANFGSTLVAVGGQLSQIEKEEQAKHDSARAMEAYTRANESLRVALHDPDSGLFNNTLGNARGLPARANDASRKIFSDVLGGLENDEQKTAFDQMWQRRHSATLDSVANYEQAQLQEFRVQQKQATLAALEDSAIENYREPSLVDADLDAARAVIRSNPDGLPAEAVEQLEREAISKMHVGVIGRLAHDDPGEALDYYERVKDAVNGADHGLVQQVVGGVAEARRASAAVAEIADNGAAQEIVTQIFGEDDLEAPAIELDAAVAREVAQTLGVADFEGMSDDEAGEYLRSPEGAALSSRVTTAYLGQQLKRFDGDLEAALVALTVSPEAAMLFLNSGRDYGAVEGGEEAREKVATFVQRYTGLSPGDGSAGIQAALNGTAPVAFEGDPDEYLRARISPVAGEAVEIAPEMATRLASFMSSAPPPVEAGLQIIRADETGVDLGWMGGAITEAPPEVLQWVYANAGLYGLGFPNGIAPWRIEAVETRGGGAAGEEALQATFASIGLPVAEAQQQASAGMLYGRPLGPYKVRGQGDLDHWLEVARGRYADNPPLLAEVERRLKNEHLARDNALETEQSELMTQAFGEIIAGGKVGEMDPLVLQTLGTENVSKLIALEDNFGPGSNKTTDPVAYYELSLMSPEEFSQTNLLQWADRLSPADLQKFIDDQAKLRQPGTQDAQITGMRTRTQIVGDAVNMLELEPSKKPDDAEAIVTIERMLDGRIGEWSRRNKGEAPGAQEIQEMLDLIIMPVPGKPANDFWRRMPGTFGLFDGGGAGTRNYELTEEERAGLVIADTFGEIPVEQHDIVATGFKTLWGDDPDEMEAVQFFNDMTRVKLGAMPKPPPALDNQMSQDMARVLGRRPTEEEKAVAYAQMIAMAAGLL